MFSNMLQLCVPEKGGVNPHVTRVCLNAGEQWIRCSDTTRLSTDIVMQEEAGPYVRAIMVCTEVTLWNGTQASGECLAASVAKKFFVKCHC